jgi:hypothetical protein
MTDLENASVLIGTVDQIIGFSRRRGDRFFNQRVDSLLQTPSADPMMKNGRGHNNGSVDLFGETFVVRSRGESELGLNHLPRCL